MKCKECSACKLGYFESRPFSYVCTGTKVPFIIEDTEQECTERRLTTIKIQEDMEDMETYWKQNPYVADDGIYVPLNEQVRIGTASVYRNLIPKEVFVEAYNKYIKKDDSPINEAVPEAKWKICVDGYYPYCPICGQEPPSGHMTRHCPNCGTRLGK